jgi:hypothetical protein
MEITWYGRACFRLKGKDATVITDPCPPSTGFVAGKHDVELLTMSHDHPDHTYTRSITAGLTLTRPGEYEYSDLLVTGLRTYHDGEAGQARGENMVFSFEIDGVHICHLGDLGHLLSEEQISELGPVDVLLVPVGGETTLTPAEDRDPDALRRRRRIEGPGRPRQVPPRDGRRADPTTQGPGHRELAARRDPGRRPRGQGPNVLVALGFVVVPSQRSRTDVPARTPPLCSRVPGEQALQY